MSTPNVLQKETVLGQLIEMKDFSEEGFMYFSNAIDHLLYSYISTCLHKSETIMLTANDIYAFTEIKNLLKLLQTDFGNEQ